MTRFRNGMNAASRFTPRLEQLGDRITPSCTVVDNGGLLTITGDNHANDIQITDDGTTVTVTCDGGTSQDFTDVTKIVVNAGNGSDTVGYDLTSDGSVAVNRDVRVRSRQRPGHLQRIGRWRPDRWLSTERHGSRRERQGHRQHGGQRRCREWRDPRCPHVRRQW